MSHGPRLTGQFETTTYNIESSDGYSS